MLVRYEPETGEFFRLIATGSGRRNKPGALKQHVKANGYARICIDGLMHAAHRVAWLSVFGYWPSGDVDHINGDRLDNLREATRAENMQNERKARKTNKSGFLGVSPHGPSWRAQITLNGVSIKLGSFKTPDEAYAAYLEAKRNIHPFGML